MKNLLLILFLFISSLSFSQEYPKTIVSNGDTLIVMTMEQGREIVTDLKKYEVADSLVTYYTERDSLNQETIVFQKESIDALKEKVDNLETIKDNNETIINNKDTQIGMLQDEIERLEEEIEKQKMYKWIAVGGGVAGIITTVVIMGTLK